MLCMGPPSARARGRAEARFPEGALNNIQVTFDEILVPRGPEYGAVVRGAKRAGNAPRIVAIPAGAAASRGLQAAAGARVVIVGLCGALDPGLRVGDVVVAESAASDLDYLFDKTLTGELAAHLGATVVRARTVDRIVTTRAQRAALHEGGIRIVEMEGAHLAAGLAERGCAAVMVRVVSDGGDYDLPDISKAIDDEGRLNPLITALAMARAPRASLRFIADARRALAQLERTAAALLSR